MKNDMQKTMKNQMFACLCVLLLSACASAPLPAPMPAPESAALPVPAVCPLTEAVVPPVSSRSISKLLAFQSGARLLKAGELARALAASDTRPAGVEATLRRAMLLTVQRGSGDLAKAQALLDAIEAPATPDGAALKALAESLSAAAADARRHDEVHDKLAMQLREAQRRNEQLSEKIEALKNIERTLSKPATAVTPAAPK